MQRYSLTVDRLSLVANVLDGPQEVIKVFLYPSAGSAGLINTYIRTQNNLCWCTIISAVFKKTEPRWGFLFLTVTSLHFAFYCFSELIFNQLKNEFQTQGP